MRLGRAAVDITPAAGVELSGYVARRQPSTGVHDPLYARALWLRAGAGQLLWLHADLIGFEHDFVVMLQQDLARRLGLAPQEVLLSATHTHSGPAVIHLTNCGAYETEYVARLRADLLALAVAAAQHEEEVTLLSAEGRCTLGTERRGRATRHTDPRLAALGWRRADGTYAAALTIYGLHNVALSAENRLISADIAGRAARTLADRLPGRPTVLIVNGAAGNVNPPAVRNDFSLVAEWGDELARCAAAALDGAAAGPPQADVVASVAETLAAPVVPLTSADAAALAERFKRDLAGRSGYVPDRIRDAFDRWAAARRNDEPAALPLILQALRLGDTAIVAVAAEPFSVLGNQLTAAVGRPVYVVGYANGGIGYLAPDSAYQEGGYEVDQAFVWYGTRPIAPGAFERVRARAADLVRRLFPV